MKIDELEALASEIKLGDILVKPEDVVLSIEGKGDLKTTFPVPNCDRCLEKCCPSGVAISLFDLARFIDIGLHKFIAGTFQGYVELFLSDDGGQNVKLSRPYMAPGSPDAKDCVFLDEERKCSIYENRPLICRAYPLGIRIDENRNRLAIWLGGCQNYDISTDKGAFQRLLDNAIQDYNEKLKSNALLMHCRTRLRDLGFGKYMEDEWSTLIEYNRKNKELQRQVNDLQLTVERLRMPQDYNTIMQRLQSENDWLKERLVNLEREMKQQSERAHSIILDLTKQLSSEYRKLLEKSIDVFLQSEKSKGGGFWRK